MLEISRKKNESIIINDEITIVVIEIRNDKVRLGLEYPSHMTVHRSEVYEALRRDHLAHNPSPQPTPNRTKKVE
ncbi:MAG: carbon storage regulator [Bythopirellula sp.]